MFPATTSPVCRPIPARISGRPRARKPSFISARRARISSAALIAFSGSPARGTGAPKTAMIASPMNLSTTPSCDITLSTMPLK